MRECNWDLNHLVGKHEHRARQIRLQRVFLIVASENSILPRKQIAIAPGEFIPVDGREARHPLPDQEEVRMSNRLTSPSPSSDSDTTSTTEALSSRSSSESIPQEIL